MTAQHTQGRLVVLGKPGADKRTAIVGPNGFPTVARVTEPEDARRLAACWNACEGVSTENLEGWPGVLALSMDVGGQATVQVEKLAAERDQLRAELAAANAEIRKVEAFNDENSLKRREAEAENLRLRAELDTQLRAMKDLFAVVDARDADLAAARALLAEVLAIEEAETTALLDTGFPADALDVSMTERIRLFLDDTNHITSGADHIDVIRRFALQVVNVAPLVGIVLTVSQRPRLPLAMGNYDTVVEVRPARGAQ